jgi:hypothetical protein
MQPQSKTVIVRTAEQAASSIGERMAHMRTWLDRRAIELVDFKPVSLDFGNFAFDAHFRKSRQANLFRAEFG